MKNMKNITKIILALLVLSLQANAQLWNQVGSDIIGDDNEDNFGKCVSISGDGSVIASGSLESGLVRVYAESMGAWAQLGTDITSGLSSDQFAKSISMNSNGNLLLVGAPGDDSDGSNKGKVYLYRLVSGNWNLETEFTGDNVDDYMGTGVAVSADGNTVAIGAYTNDDAGTNAGQIKIYKYSGGSWVIDEVIYGNEDDLYGTNIKLNYSGDVLVIGMTNNDNASGTDAGLVRVFREISGNWAQIGSDIVGEVAYDRFGKSISTSYQGNIIAVGATHNDEGGTNSGSAYIYQFLSGDWQLIGKINGERAYDNAGSDISINYNGTKVAIGAEQNYETNTDAGHVRVFENNSGVWEQLGQDIDGEHEGDKLGYSVALSADGTIYVTGAPFYSYSGSNKGLIKTFVLVPLPEITAQPSSQTDLCFGSVVDFSVTGNYINTYQWQVSVDSAASWDNLSDDSNYSGTSGNTLTIQTILSFNNYQYRCFLVGDGGETYTDTVILTFEESAPVITSTHSNIEVPATSGCDQTTLDDYTSGVVALDNCSASEELIISQSPTQGSDISGASNVITLTVTDEVGNTTEVQFEINVIDNTNPTLTCIANQNADFSTGTHYIVSGNEFDLQESDDNCGIFSIENDINSSSTLDGVELPEGITTITWTVTDNSGNVNSCSFDVEVSSSVAINTIYSETVRTYPNPCSDYITIESDKIIQSLCILDVTGKQLVQKVVESNTFHLSLDMLNNGLYFVELQYVSGREVFKILKK